MNLFKSKWSKWTDLSIGKVNEYIYLLQYRRHKNGRVQFRIERSSPAWGVEVPKIDDLKEV